MIDPVAAFRDSAARSDRMFWLDGGGSRDWSGRRSIIGVLGPEDVSLTFDAERGHVERRVGAESEVVGSDVFDVLAEEIARDKGDPDVHWVGYLGYACRTDLPGRTQGGLPDAVWMRVRSPLFIEHDAPPVDRPGIGAEETEPPAWYVTAFEQVQEQLHAGNSYEVNLTYRDRIDSKIDPVEAYLRLRAVNPAPYAGYLRHHDVRLLSSSPERFATIDRHRGLSARPIKGTTPRGATPEEDERLREHLSEDPKLRAENLMITDLLRNDLSMVCAPGTVEVPGLMEVESYPSVHQLVTTVRGRLRDDVATVGALRALFPAGSMTGAPKRMTMHIIDEIEATPRGVYAGAFGWVSADGRADLGVVIRSLVATPSGAGWSYTFGTGGGITVRSDVREEWAETSWKAERLRSVLQGG
ncbi:MAG: anthranilate synthase component I family protein [Actinomycetota bacterium]|nr:anthranilate synthase component I family protein [Actinomycetota bacterium]